MAITPPHELTLRCYGVGFGDCFLLTFHYKGTTGDRHMLIDFGCTQKPPKAGDNLMKDIAKDITAVVGSKLHAIVATHRHTDHISGFATNTKGNAPGDVIGRVKPNLVIQPWTEKLDAPIDSEGPKGAGPRGQRRPPDRASPHAGCGGDEPEGGGAPSQAAQERGEVHQRGLRRREGREEPVRRKAAREDGEEREGCVCPVRQQSHDAQDTLSRRDVRRAGASDDFAEEGRRRSES